MDHPSLVALMNMMANVQMKQRESGEALRLYELSLRGLSEENGGQEKEKEGFCNTNSLSTS